MLLTGRSVLMSVMMIVMSIGSISAPISAAGRSSTAAAKLFQTIDLPQRDTSGAKDPDVDAGADITLQNINFTYPMRADIRVLAGLNVTFPAGKITAIVGPSGSGKSTIVGLLERWYELDGDFQANLKVTDPRWLFYLQMRLTTEHADSLVPQRPDQDWRTPSERD
jgi:ATP-binding cassette, subfamily B (MDR/TAP), member 1